MVIGGILGLLIFSVLGFYPIYKLFYPRFEIGQMIEVTKTNRGHLVSKTIREYGTFGDIFWDKFFGPMIGLVMLVLWIGLFYSLWNWFREKINGKRKDGELIK